MVFLMVKWFYFIINDYYLLSILSYLFLISNIMRYNSGF